MQVSVSQGDGIFSEDFVRGVLEPHHDELRACVTRAWKRASSQFLDLARPDPAFRPQVVHQYMADEARTRFGNADGVTIVEPRTATRFLLHFRENVIVQFKKLDLEMRTRNYPTRRARAFDCQMPLVAVPRGCRVTVGYQTSRDATTLECVLVVCQSSREPRWWYELEDASANIGVLGASNPLRKQRVKPKQLELQIEKSADST